MVTEMACPRNAKYCNPVPRYSAREPLLAEFLAWNPRHEIPAALLRARQRRIQTPLCVDLAARDPLIPATPLLLQHPVCLEEIHHRFPDSPHSGSLH